ncbi:hypothetical protein [Okeania sp. SIO1I7]|uniref:hypothetical protein n=1 Tax=Okeania sp. SIO1I7 TaxID=2607772 RepID=UPI0013FC51C5|nr:hypothetical protein [Okeania sp. SIO1I7]NET24105.1 hypothetical protein [Okeania sp. SIO1I7]
MTKFLLLPSSLLFLISDFFLLPSFLFLLSATATPKIIFPTCPRNEISQLPKPPLSQTQPSIPSLWLTQDYFGEELIYTWFVDPDDTSVILVVRKLIWDKKGYLERYKFINHFGNVARQYGYNLQVCEPRNKKPIAAYFCDFENAPLNCNVEIDYRFGRSLFSSPKDFTFITTTKEE